MCAIGGLPSSIEVVTIHTQGYRERRTNRGGIAWLTASNAQTQQHQHGHFCHTSSLIYTKAMACLRALNWVMELGLTTVRILMESYELIQSLKTNKISNINIHRTMSRLHTLVAQFAYCQVLQVSSEEVVAAKQSESWCCRNRMDCWNLYKYIKRLRKQETVPRVALFRDFSSCNPCTIKK